MTRASGPLPPHELTVLGEYQGLVFVDKPGGLQTEPDLRHADALLVRLAKQLNLPVERLHALSRLDTGVSGVVTFSLSSDSRRLVQGWRERGAFRRRYLALAGGVAAAAQGTWAEAIGRTAGSLRGINGRHPEAARTDYQVVSSSQLNEGATPPRVHLLALSPITGRTHQLRVHCSAHGLPLLGDRAYGGVSRLVSPNGRVRGLARVLLHAAWVELPLSEPRRVCSSIPLDFTELWADLGGSCVDFSRAVEAQVGA